MITKVHQSSNLSAAMGYVYQQYKDPQVVDSTCMDPYKEGAQAEISQAISLRPKISKPVFHATLSVPSGDKLTNEQWQEIASEYTSRMGFNGAPYVAVRHMDTDHHHIHIVASRVTQSGQLVSDSFEKYRSQEIARDLEIKHDLTRVPSSWEVPERARTQDEYHVIERTGQESARDKMRDIIEQELSRNTTAPDLAVALSRRNVTLVPKVTQDGNKVVGVYFEKDGTRIPGSKIAREYSWPNLSKKLEYEHDRDFKRMSRAPESDARKQVETPIKRDDSSPSRPEVLRTQAPVESTHSPDSGRQNRENIRPESAPRTPVKTGPGRDYSSQPVPDSPRTVVQNTELRSPTKVPSEPSKKADPAPGLTPSSKTLEVPKASQTPRVEQLDRPKNPTGMTVEQARRGMEKVLERATYDKGWKAWADSVRAQGVEPIPKGTQTDPTNVRGMYFSAAGHTIPGSAISREHSFKGLEGRIGGYESTRDSSAFRAVEIPGRGREIMPVQARAPREIPAPIPDRSAAVEAPNVVKTEVTSPSQKDTLTPALKRLERDNIQVVRNPQGFQGEYKGTLQDAQGISYGVMAKGNEVAIVQLHEGVQIGEARKNSQGHILSSMSLPPDTKMSPGDQVQWRDNGSGQAIVRVVQEPTRTLDRPEIPTQPSPSPAPFDQSKAPESARNSVQEQDTLTPALKRLERDNIQVVRNPQGFQGEYKGTLQDAQGISYGVMAKGNEVAIVQLHEGVQIGEARKNSQGHILSSMSLPPDTKMSPGDQVQWRDNGSGQAIVRVVQEPTRAPTIQPTMEPTRTPNRPEISAQSPPSPAPVDQSAAPNTTRNLVPKQDIHPEIKTPAPALLSSQEWTDKANEKGISSSVMRPGDVAVGRLQTRRLTLRDGDYNIVETDKKELVLVKSDQNIERHRSTDKTPKISIRMSPTGRTLVKNLERDRDRGR